jgi:hypothetical protein
MAAYHPTYSWDDGVEVTVCKRKPVPPPIRHPPGFRMLTDCLALSFEAGVMEPFFCELALYDAALG